LTFPEPTGTTANGLDGGAEHPKPAPPRARSRPPPATKRARIGGGEELGDTAPRVAVVSGPVAAMARPFPRTYALPDECKRWRSIGG
jgi:hypothetical protein